MKQKPAPAPLDNLLSQAEEYATFMMRKDGRLPPTLFAETPKGVLCYVPHDLSDFQAKDNFANTARLICAAHAATAAVMTLEAWATFAKPGETLDRVTPPSESLDRREFVVLMGEAAGQKRQKMLPIIRTDAGDFFGFGEFDSSSYTGVEGRFVELLSPRVPNAEHRALAKAALAMMGVTDASLGSEFPRN